MKLKQALCALIIPISFILILFILQSFPLPALDKYAFGGIFVTCIALFISFIALKIDKKRFKDMGLFFQKKTPSRFSKGFIIGLCATALILAIIINFSSLELNYKAHSNIPVVLLWLLAFLPLAFMEELIFRGYAFIKLNESVGLWPAQIALALLFTWYHDFTGLTFFNQLMGPGIWALIYGIAAVWSKGLAFPTGLHMAINVVLALVGEKDERHALWNLEYPAEVSPTLQNETEHIGILLQIAVLIIGILLTEYYRRNKLKSSKTQ